MHARLEERKRESLVQCRQCDFVAKNPEWLRSHERRHASDFRARTAAASRQSWWHSTDRVQAISLRDGQEPAMTAAAVRERRVQRTAGPLPTQARHTTS